ncbi:MAG: ELM1/GtrOC1 family putative glycosyltransferase [Candidatus Tantalella remota]|nr:ELM1/GtrOC1 family putative glycosyltransferase [Candidatus Tantalella remota]
MLDLIASLVIKGLNRVLHVLPMRFDLWLGRCFGGMAYLFSGKRRRVAYANLKAAFAAEKSPKELKKITQKVYTNMVQSFFELVAITKIDRKYVDKHIKIHDLDRIERLSKTGKGVIFISAHFGNWELNAVTSGIMGFPLYFLGREQKMKRLYELVNRIRESKGNVVIRKGTDVKKMIRVLREGKIVGMAGDQNAGVNGQLVDMFGRPASIAIGPFRIAERTGASILPAFIHRSKGQKHELFLEEEMFIEKGVEDLTPYMTRFNELLEGHLREHPDQWLWMHKRWKMTPLKKIMVLDDGKKGHLKQSIAVFKQIERYRADEGYSPENVELEVVKIKFRSKKHKTVFNLLSVFFGPSCQGRMGLLKWALDEESYTSATTKYADVIVSCGSSLFAVNKILRYENYARNVAVLDPGPFNRRGFDLIVMPRHDVKGEIPKTDKKPGYIITDLAPNLIDPESLAGLKEQGPGGDGKKCIGVLFGGDNPVFGFGKDLTEAVVENVKLSAEKINGCFYMTTSRRTPAESEKLLEEELGGDPRCLKFVAGTRDEDEHTVEKILAASDVVIVSGESISMVSEAVSSGKPVLVFMPDKKTDHQTKYEKFVNDLDQKGYIKQVKVEDIPRAVSEAGGMETVLPDDDDRIKGMMYRLF